MCTSYLTRKKNQPKSRCGGWAQCHFHASCTKKEKLCLDVFKSAPFQKGIREKGVNESKLFWKCKEWQEIKRNEREFFCTEHPKWDKIWTRGFCLEILLRGKSAKWRVLNGLCGVLCLGQETRKGVPNLWGGGHTLDISTW